MIHLCLCIEFMKLIIAKRLKSFYDFLFYIDLCKRKLKRCRVLKSKRYED